MSRFRRVNANNRGRDLAVGDIHGHFERLQRCLDEVGFDPEVDRLFSVGDLVDRGPASEQALDWLAQPWFHAVQGNHEALAIAHLRGGRVDLRCTALQAGLVSRPSSCRTTTLRRRLRADAIGDRGADVAWADRPLACR